MAKPVVRISDMDAAADFAAVLERVHAGVDVVIEHGATPVAVVHPARPVRRTIEECIELLPADSSGTADVDFADDVAAAVASHPQSLSPPAWD
jgi:antitoxin (DNA-binding transcriptional repressor) of toxin-antitoxin stability system